MSAPAVTALNAALQFLHRQLTAEREKSAALLDALNSANSKLAMAAKEVEDLYLTTSLEMERKSTVFNTVSSLKELLDLDTYVPPGGEFVIVTNATPRVAAGV